MSEKKQIVEEMARHIPARIFAYDVSENSANLDKLHREIVALHLYRAGYRKQSEGEWIDQYQGLYVNQLYKCSLCGETAFHDDKRWFLTHHCPNCGAKMKGGAE